MNSRCQTDRLSVIDPEVLKSIDVVKEEFVQIKNIDSLELYLFIFSVRDRIRRS